MTRMHRSRGTPGGTISNSPISRIVPFALLLLTAISCDKLGLGSNSPTAPSGPPAAGSAIVYDAIGASDADGVGSSVVCPPFTDCPNGTGYAQVATRQLKAQGFDIEVVHTPPCGTAQVETTLFPDFRAETREVNFKDATISLTGKCNATEPVVSRA